MVDGKTENALLGIPQRVLLDKFGRILVLHPIVPGGPAVVFDQQGKFLQTLGRTGDGPGEARRPYWIDNSLGDSIRVFEGSRLSVFTFNLEFARVVTIGRPDFAHRVAVLRPGVHALISSLFSGPAVAANPIVVRRDDGLILHRIEMPAINGGLARSVLTRDRTNSKDLWVVQYQENELSGYRVLSFSEAGREELSFERLPAWWSTRKRGASVLNPVTVVSDVRQISERSLAVLIGSPRPDWKRVPFDSLSAEGYVERLDSVLEIVDVCTRKLIGTVRVGGSPISISSDNSFSTFRADPDGFPVVSVWRFTPPDNPDAAC
jgi:hypothetical protein